MADSDSKARVRVALHVGGKLQQQYVPESEAAQAKESLLAEAVGTGKFRPSTWAGSPTAKAILKADGSPVGIGYQRPAHRRGMIIVKAKSEAGENVRRIITATTTEEIREGFKVAVDYLVGLYLLDEKHKATLLDSYPAFALRFGIEDVLVKDGAWARPRKRL